MVDSHPCTIEVIHDKDVETREEATVTDIEVTELHYELWSLSLRFRLF